MDISIILLFQSFREAIGGCLNTFFDFISMVAVDYYLVIPALCLFWIYNKKSGVTVLASYGTSILFGSALKATFCVYRPWIRSSEVKPLESVLKGASGYSFPSGHSTSTSGFYCGLINVFRKYKPLCIFFGSMIFITMISRLYVGVHTPQDVLVGCAVGIVAAFVVLGISKLTDKYKNADIFIVLGAALVCVALLLYLYFKPYPMDYVDGKLLVDPKKMTVDGFKDPGVFFGIVLGWFVERRFIKFDISGSTPNKVMMCLLGGILYILYETTLVSYLGKMADVGVVYFLLKMSSPFIFMTFYPLIFKKISHKFGGKQKNRYYA